MLTSGVLLFGGLAYWSPLTGDEAGEQPDVLLLAGGGLVELAA